MPMGTTAIGWKEIARRNQETLAAILATEATPWERVSAVVPPSTEKEPEGLTQT